MKLRTTVKRESGAALITALIVLVVMVMIGVSGMEGTVMEEKMTMNFIEREKAEQAADSMSRSLASWLSKQNVQPTNLKKSDCSTPPNCGLGSGYPVFMDDQLVSGTQDWGSNDFAWWETWATEYTGSATVPTQLHDVAEQPRGVIEYRGFNAPATSGIASNLDPSKSMQGIGWHYFNFMTAGTGTQVENYAGIEATFKKWY